MATYFLDYTATFNGDGSTAAQAVSDGAVGAFNTFDGVVMVADDEFWLRRTSTWNIEASLILVPEGAKFIGWPKSNDKYYALRPASGTSEGWDGDAGTYCMLSFDNASYFFKELGDLVSDNVYFSRLHMRHDVAAESPIFVNSAEPIGWVFDAMFFDTTQTTSVDECLYLRLTAPKFYNCTFHFPATGGTNLFLFCSGMLMINTIFNIEKFTLKSIQFYEGSGYSGTQGGQTLMNITVNLANHVSTGNDGVFDLFSRSRLCNFLINNNTDVLGGGSDIGIMVGELDENDEYRGGNGSLNVAYGTCTGEDMFGTNYRCLQDIWNTNFASVDSAFLGHLNLTHCHIKGDVTWQGLGFPQTLYTGASKSGSSSIRTDNTTFDNGVYNISLDLEEYGNKIISTQTNGEADNFQQYSFQQSILKVDERRQCGPLWSLKIQGKDYDSLGFPRLQQSLIYADLASGANTLTLYCAQLWFPETLTRENIWITATYYDQTNDINKFVTNQDKTDWTLDSYLWETQHPYEAIRTTIDITTDHAQRVPIYVYTQLPNIDGYILLDPYLVIT